MSQKNKPYNGEPVAKGCWNCDHGAGGLCFHPKEPQGSVTFYHSCKNWEIRKPKEVKSEC